MLWQDRKFHSNSAFSFSMCSASVQSVILKSSRSGSNIFRGIFEQQNQRREIGIYKSLFAHLKIECQRRILGLKHSEAYPLYKLCLKGLSRNIFVMMNIPWVVCTVQAIVITCLPHALKQPPHP